MSRMLGVIGFGSVISNKTLDIHNALNENSAEDGFRDLSVPLQLLSSLVSLILLFSPKYHHFHEFTLAYN